MVGRPLPVEVAPETEEMKTCQRPQRHLAAVPDIGFAAADIANDWTCHSQILHHGQAVRVNRNNNETVLFCVMESFDSEGKIRATKQEVIFFKNVILMLT